MIKVCKFGGSSLASGEQFKKVKDIVKGDETRCVVVVSAPGRRFDGDSKITDLLYLCHAHLKYGVSYESIFELIEQRYCEIRSYCGLSCDLDSEFELIRSKMCKRMNVDYLASRGEYLNAKLMAEYLGFEFADAKDWLFFGYDGKVDFHKTNDALRKIISETPKVVIPGFYGAMPDGSIRTFSRGGSDITGAIAAAAIGAGAYENWTDVSGILMADPRIVSNPKSIEKITYAELREMSYMGAEVLHEEAVFPVRKVDIPLYIKNTNDPEAAGTLIRESFPNDLEDDDSSTRFITGISGRKHFTIITLHKVGMSGEVGLIRKALEVVERFGVPIEHVPSGVDSFSLVIASDALENCLHDMISELQTVCQPDTVKVTEDISLIAVVGRKMAFKPGVSGRLFATLGSNNINIRLIEQSADEIIIVVGVKDEDFEKTIKVLYYSFT